MSGKTNRTKGHNLEREIARMFRDELGFKFAKTSRLASRILDNCKVDIAGIPYLIQAKAGYAKARPKPEEIFQEIEDALKANFPEDDPVHCYPKVLIHKISGRHKYHNLVTMPYNDFKYLLLNQKERGK
jgi:hypothetical protein